MRIFSRDNKKKSQKSAETAKARLTASSETKRPSPENDALRLELYELEDLLDRHSKSRDVLKHLALFESKLYGYQVSNRTHLKQKGLSDIDSRVLLAATKQLGNLIDESNPKLWSLLLRMRNACANDQSNAARLSSPNPNKQDEVDNVDLKSMLDKVFENNLEHSDFEHTVPFAKPVWQDTQPLEGGGLFR